MSRKPTTAATTTTQASTEFTLRGVWRLLLKLLGVGLGTAEKAISMVDNLADAGLALTGMAKDAAQDLRTKSAVEAEADFKADLARINEKRKQQGLKESQAKTVINDVL